jgi:hypothetical protein
VPSVKRAERPAISLLAPTDAAAVVAWSGSVALLGDTVHNLAAALHLRIRPTMRLVPVDAQLTHAGGMPFHPS